MYSAANVSMVGWRLDSWILSKRIAEKAKMCEIRHEWCVDVKQPVLPISDSFLRQLRRFRPCPRRDGF